MSFFQKFNPVGSTPIVTQKRVIKTGDAPPSKKTTAASNASRLDVHHPRRVASSITLQAPARPTTNGTASPLKRKLDPARSTPNLKRDSLKPPSPESLPTRSTASSSRSPQSHRLESSDDDSDDDRASKRSKVGSASPVRGSVDRSRTMVHPISFRTKDPVTGGPVKPCEFINAEDIANVGLKGWSRRRGQYYPIQSCLEPARAPTAIGMASRAAGTRSTPSNVGHAADSSAGATELSEAQLVGLNYPGIPQQEKFQLVKNSDPDEFDPVAEILTTMEKVADHLVPPDIADMIHSETSGGIVYKMRRALKHGDTSKFLEQLKNYNSLVRTCRKDGTFKRRIASMSALPFQLTEHILQQSYARTVALEVEGLKDYQAFSSEVYGELLPKFTAKIFKEARLTADKVFIDLGSGTGNVVLHAALETGCEAWGCEKMEKPARLAERQRREFIARCRTWGINHGAVHLEHDTFLENRAIAEQLRRADVLLVNNFAFEPDLNQKLLDMFLDLKEGAMVFSLKPFVPANHVITTRNAENPVNRLRMVEREYFSREVSWTDSGGKYYVHTVDGNMLREFMEREERMSRRR